MCAAVFAALLSCEKPDEGQTGGPEGGKPSPDKIEITPKTHEFSAEGELTCQVKVQSSGDWTLTPETTDWLTPSATSGKNGATVTFTATANTKTEKRGPVTFTFKTGKATATFKAEQLGKSEEPQPQPGNKTLEFKNPEHANVVLPAEGAQHNFPLNTDVALANLEVIVDSADGNDEEEWITPTNWFFNPNLYVTLLTNEGPARKATLIIRAKDGSAKDLVMNITQEGAPSASYLEFQEPSMADYKAPAAGDEKLIQLKTNLEDSNLELSIEYIDGEGWVETNMGGMILQGFFGMTIKPNTGAERKAKLTVKAKDGSVNDLVMNITQEAGSTEPEPQPGDKVNVVNFFDAQLYSDWANAAPLTNMGQFTVEFLASAETYDKGAGDYALSTFLGIEGHFLIRAVSGNLEVVAQKSSEEKIELKNETLQANKWYHIAVTFDNGDITVYINGQQKAKQTVELKEVTFATGTWTQETNWGSKRHFYLGHSVDQRRCLKGEMSEVRIWNKVLSASEITAEGHYYEVEPSSEGLVAYWKLNEGSGDVAKDSSNSGNDLKGHNKITANQGGADIGGYEIQWREVNSNKVN